jgi:serine/threonine-protein phosphatase PGAM5
MPSYRCSLPVALFLVLASSFPSFAQGAASVPAAPFARTIYLVRHGAYVPDPAADPQLGSGLTPLGIAQARLLAARFRGMNVRLDSMTSSTMTRARETAVVMHETLSDGPLDQSPQLVECTPPYGWTQSQPVDEQVACANRLDAVFAERFTPARGAARHDVLVAHGNVIRYLVTKALRVDTRAWAMMSVANASLSVVQISADGSMLVLSVGDIGHIPPSMQGWGRDSDPHLVVPK